MTSLSSTLLFLLMSNFTGLLSASYLEQNCKGALPGDCDPQACGGPCESRYVRFHDQAIKGDRTIKSCQCLDDKYCSLSGVLSQAGCKSYTDLGTTSQRLIRSWTMDSRDRKNRHSNDILLRFSDRLRHQQLVNGNSLFCCRSRRTSKKEAMYLKSAASFVILPFLYFLPFLRLNA